MVNTTINMGIFASYFLAPNTTIARFEALNAAQYLRAGLVADPENFAAGPLLQLVDRYSDAVSSPSGKRGCAALLGGLISDELSSNAQRFQSFFQKNPPPLSFPILAPEGKVLERVMKEVSTVPYDPIPAEIDEDRIVSSLKSGFANLFGNGTKRPAFDVQLKKSVRWCLRVGYSENQIKKHMDAYLSFVARIRNNSHSPDGKDLERIKRVESFLEKNFGSGFLGKVFIHEPPASSGLTFHHRHDSINHWTFLEALGLDYPDAILEEGMHSIAGGLASRVLDEGATSNLIIPLMGDSFFPTEPRVSGGMHYGDEHLVAQIVASATSGALYLSYLTGDEKYLIHALGKNGRKALMLLCALEDFQADDGEFKIDIRRYAALILGNRWSEKNLLLIGCMLRLWYRYYSYTGVVSESEQEAIESAIEKMKAELEKPAGRIAQKDGDLKDLEDDILRVAENSKNPLLRKVAASIITFEDPMTGVRIYPDLLSKEDVQRMVENVKSFFRDKWSTAVDRFRRREDPNAIAEQIEEDFQPNGEATKTASRLRKVVSWKGLLLGDEAWANEVIHPLNGWEIVYYAVKANCLQTTRGRHYYQRSHDSGIYVIVDILQNMFGSFAMEKGVKLDLDMNSFRRYAASTSRNIFLDTLNANTREEILMELIINAIKNGDKRVVIGYDDNRHAVAIENDGPGIPAGTDVWAPGVTTSKDGKGGYGLTKAKEDARSIGLEITYTSEPGKTVFYFHLRKSDQ